MILCSNLSIRWIYMHAYKRRWFIPCQPMWLVNTVSNCTTRAACLLTISLFTTNINYDMLLSVCVGYDRTLNIHMYGVETTRLKNHMNMDASGCYIICPLLLFPTGSFATDFIIVGRESLIESYILDPICSPKFNKYGNRGFYIILR